VELHQLRYFLAAAEAGSVSRAAERCHVAQPSLSQQIRKLEQSLGVTLFDRLGRGVALTDAGRALVPRARQILAGVREAETNLRRDVDEGHGMVAIGAIPTVAPYVLPPAIARLRQALPACDVRITEDLTEHLIDAVVETRLDCAVVSTPLDHDLIELEIVGEEELLVVVPKSHPLAAAGHVDLGTLNGEAAVTLEDMHCLGRQIQGFCSSRRVAPRITCSTAQLGTVFDLVATGLGVSVVPEMASAVARRRSLAFLRVKPRPLSRQIAVAWRKDRSRSRAARRFAELLREDFEAGRHRLGARDSRG
jgi:LysR family hydrogen peroxide-inducible transcriptional activator